MQPLFDIHPFSVCGDLEPDGKTVSVRSALQVINAVLSEVLSDQEGDFDTDTRWCLKWFETHGFDKAGYGEGETLASAYNTSVAGLARSGAVHAKAGEVRLLAQQAERLAKAVAQCDALITRDAGFYRDYFKGLKVIVPKA